MSRAQIYTRLCRFSQRAIPRFRAMILKAFTGIPFTKVGVHFKLYGCDRMQIGKGVRIGDFCWVEAVSSYGGITYHPKLQIGQGVAVSDLTHISCVDRIAIGRDCLIGSKVYIGDHSHGPTRGQIGLSSTAPARRNLDNVSPIEIGDRCWIGDGAVILGGAKVAAGSIIGANSIVSIKEVRPALIVGSPARVAHYLD
jgi:acetyltransferase-like isoleucine patch superfamily enzyme